MIDEHLNTDCKIVFESFNECHSKMKLIIEKYEEDFLFQTQLRGSVKAHVRGYSGY